MKRAIILIAIAALVVACCSVGCSRSADFVSTASEKLSHAVEKAKELLPDPSESEDAEDQEAMPETDAPEEGGRWSLPSLGDLGFAKGVLSSPDDVYLVPVDDYGANYAFEYDGEQFSAYFDGVSWKVYDSYKIANHGDIEVICQALINEHPVYGSDWESFRTADDMTFEWEQHNLAYKALPEDNHWRNDAKDVDLDPYDQGKTFPEIYEARTGQKLDLKKYLPW